jgi:predicted glycosyltransferase
MRIYDFANVFYLPADPALGFDEGFARLDHIQPVAANHLSNHRGMRLAPEALEVLKEWLIQFLTGSRPTNSVIEEYRQMVIEDEPE